MKLEHHLDHFTLGLVFHKCPPADKTLIRLTYCQYFEIAWPLVSYSDSCLEECAKTILDFVEVAELVENVVAFVEDAEAASDIADIVVVVVVAVVDVDVVAFGRHLSVFGHRQPYNIGHFVTFVDLEPSSFGVFVVAPFVFVVEAVEHASEDAFEDASVDAFEDQAMLLTEEAKNRIDFLSIIFMIFRQINTKSKILGHKYCLKIEQYLSTTY